MVNPFPVCHIFRHLLSKLLLFLDSLYCKQYGPRSGSIAFASMIKSSLKYTWIYAADIKSKQQYQDYKNLSWVWRCQKNLSQGSPIGIMMLAEWWQSVIARDIFFYLILTWIKDFFSCLPLNTSFILEKLEKDFQKILNMLRCNMVTSF